MTPGERAVSLERLHTRLRRLEQQIRTFKELHASEMQIILDELADIASEFEATAAEPTDTAAPASGVFTDAADPAAGSPKRAKWMAEKQRPVSRRELLRGREES